MTRRAAPHRILAAALVAAVVVPSLVARPAAAAKKKKRTPEPTAVPRPTDPYRVTIETNDGVSLAASWRPVTQRPDAPAVLLLHDFSRERRDWEPLAPEFTERGLATLAIDLRAHGESTKKNGKPLPISPRQMNDPNGFPRDVEAACRWLRERAPKLGAVGLSLGGSLTVLASAAGLVDTAVVVSTNADRVSSLAGGRPTAARGALFIASEQAPQRADSARALYASASEPKKLLLVPGAAHNLVLFAEHPEAKAAMFDWLAARLGATRLPVPTPIPSPTPAPVPPRK
ncbi:MAG: alpha/beta hydrolase [Thermoanaerobaculia bacterium]